MTLLKPHKKSTYMTTKKIQEQYINTHGVMAIWGRSCYPRVVPPETKEAESPEVSEEDIGGDSP